MSSTVPPSVLEAALQRALATALEEVATQPNGVHQAAERVRSAMVTLGTAVDALVAAAGGSGSVPALRTTSNHATPARRQRGRRATPEGEPEGEFLVVLPRVLTNYLRLELPPELRRAFGAVISKPRGPGWSDHLGMDRQEAESLLVLLRRVRTASGQYQHVNRAVADLEAKLAAAGIV